MTELTYRQYRWQRVMQHIPASLIGAMVFSKFLHYVDPKLMRISKDRLSIPSLLTGLPVVILTSTGAKSGQVRTKPVVGVPDGDNVALVASNWGQSRNPAWYYNLQANPVAELEFGGHTGTYTAREVTAPDEYQRLWQKATEVYIGFDKYQQRADNRKIPIMLMVPHVEKP
ncbi:MAG: nitroreductase family deazaflavin-dependent oxidoreductase [Chloroflexi bacterium]|nr:MAG: nitroreductase family deazaflavin-dependent oxidoreductase [Chloroflexota bacterium]